MSELLTQDVTASEGIPLTSGIPEKVTEPSDKRVRLFFSATADTLFQEARKRMRQMELREQRELLDAFVARAKGLAFVKEVWAEFDPALSVTVIVAERNLDEELSLYAIFRDASSALSNPTMGDLAVLPASYSPDDAELVFRR